MRMLVLLVLAPFVLAACAAGGADETPTASGPPTGTPAPSDPPSLPPLEMGPVPAQIFGAIIADATDRGVDPATVTVVEAISVTWSDGSIGCPEPGMMYTMALVDGYRVVLEAADGTLYDYHVGQGNHFVLCPPERSRNPIEDGL